MVSVSFTFVLWFSGLLFLWFPFVVWVDCSVIWMFSCFLFVFAFGFGLIVWILLVVFTALFIICGLYGMLFAGLWFVCFDLLVLWFGCLCCLICKVVLFWFGWLVGLLF